MFHGGGRGEGSRYKHVIEPEVTISRTTSFDNREIIMLDSNDYVYGGTTRVTYGVTQRLLAKRGGVGKPAARHGPRRVPRLPGAAASGAQDLLSVQLSQSYYSNENASTVDGTYGGAYLGREPDHYSPIALAVRTNPSQAFGATLRLEYHAGRESVRDDLGGRQRARHVVAAHGRQLQPGEIRPDARRANRNRRP